MDDVVVPTGEQSPALHIHVNPVYALYQYLAREAQLPPQERNPDTAHAAALMRWARNPRAVQGYWSEWEQGFAMDATPQEAAGGLRRAMEETVERFAEAMKAAESVYHETLWPRRSPLLEDALRTIRNRLVPHFPGMAKEQGDLLGLVWPERVDAFLVPDSYESRGAYSHPLTVDVSHNNGIELCETLLHEATHVADVNTAMIDKEHLADRLISRLEADALGHKEAWNAWHAVIFASSAWQVRTHIESDYRDYALRRDLYSWFKLPHLPALWEAFASGSMDEEALIEAVAKQLTGLN